MSKEFDPEIIKEQDGLKAGVVQITWLPAMEVGWGNGYVSVPKDHPWYDKDYDNIEVEIHGGLTYSERHGDEYWIGFDCAHLNDNPVNRDRAFVINETISLLDQAVAVFTKFQHK